MSVNITHLKQYEDFQSPNICNYYRARYSLVMKYIVIYFYLLSLIIINHNRNHHFVNLNSKVPLLAQGEDYDLNVERMLT